MFYSSVSWMHLHILNHFRLKDVKALKCDFFVITRHRLLSLIFFFSYGMAVAVKVKCCRRNALIAKYITRYGSEHFR